MCELLYICIDFSPLMKRGWLYICVDHDCMTGVFIRVCYRIMLYKVGIINHFHADTRSGAKAFPKAVMTKIKYAASPRGMS